MSPEIVRAGRSDISNAFESGLTCLTGAYVHNLTNYDSVCIIQLFFDIILHLYCQLANSISRSIFSLFVLKNSCTFSIFIFNSEEKNAQVRYVVTFIV